MLNQRSKYCQILLICGNQEENGEEEREDLGLRMGGGLLYACVGAGDLEDSA